MLPFSARLTRELGWCRVTLTGELDIATCPLLERNLRRAERVRPALILLDLRDLTFMDVCGLRVVLEADQRARARRCELAIAHAPRIVFRLAGLSGVDSLLWFVSDRAAMQFEPVARSLAAGPTLRAP